MLLTARRLIPTLAHLLPVVVLNTTFEVPESLDILTVSVVRNKPTGSLFAKA